MADRVNGRPLHEGRCPESRGKESNLVSSITLPGLSIVLPRPTPVRKINVQGHRAMGIELTEGVGRLARVAQRQRLALTTQPGRLRQTAYGLAS